VGVIVYTPVLAVCGACIVLAFHRAEVVDRDAKLWVKAVSFITLYSLVTLFVVGATLLIGQKLSNDKKSWLAEIKDTVKQGIRESISSLLIPPQNPSKPVATSAPVDPPVRDDLSYKVSREGNPRAVGVLGTPDAPKPAPRVAPNPNASLGDEPSACSHPMLFSVKETSITKFGANYAVAVTLENKQGFKKDDQFQLFFGDDNEVIIDSITDSADNNLLRQINSQGGISTIRLEWPVAKRVPVIVKAYASSFPIKHVLCVDRLANAVQN